MINNVLIATMLGFMLVACGDKRLNQKEIKEALGIVDNQASEIRIGGVLFRIPSQYKIKTVDADEDNVKAKEIGDAVSRVIFHMDLSSWFDPPPTALAEGNALVRIEVSKHGYEDPVKRIEKFEKRAWASQRDIPEWGLREYISANFPEQGGWGVLSYRALNANTPRDGPVIYGCNTDYIASKNNQAKAVLCASWFQSLNGPTVLYVYSGKLLPRWNEVHTEVLNLVNSLIVEE